MGDELHNITSTLVDSVRKTHRVVMFSGYLLLGFIASVSALLLWLILDDILLGKPLSAAFLAVLTLWNGRTFVGVMADQRQMRLRMAALEEMVERMKRTHG